MKILMTSDTYLPSLGGGEYHVFYLKRELERLRHTVLLYTNHTDVDKKHIEENVVRCAYKGIKSVPSLFIDLWKLSKGVDLLHAHYSFRLGFVLACVSLLRRKPLVVTQHGLGLLPPSGGESMMFKLWRWWNMKRAKIIISTSHDLSLDIHNLGFGKKIVHIPNGYDGEKFLPMDFPVSNEKVVLTVRRLVPKTGIQYLIAALPYIREKIPSVRFLSVGGGRLQSELEDLAQEKGVFDCVTFMGAVSHEELLQYYAKASVVVFPSTAESTSLACIEAMALEKPIVASRVGGLIELLGSDESRGYLVPLTETEHCNYEAPFEIDEQRIRFLADAVVRALQGGLDVQEKTAAAGCYARKTYQWSIIAKRTEDEVYRAL